MTERTQSLGATHPWLTLPFAETNIAATATSSTRGLASYLNRRLVHALQDALRQLPKDEELDSKPLLLDCKAPICRRLNCYVYEVTTSTGERQEGAHRVQLTNGIDVPAYSGRLQFDRRGGATAILAGYVHEWDVFVMWDADLHDFGSGFPYSKGVQVHESTILNALTQPWATQERRLRPGGMTVVETVLAARASRLIPALQKRLRLSMAALLET